MDRRTCAFFLSAFAWTWLWQAPMTLGYEGSYWVLFAGLAAIGPSLAAVVVTRGRVLRTLRPHGGWHWYLLAALVPPLARAAALGLSTLGGSALPSSLLVVPAAGVVLLPPLGEELGWRGFAYPRLAERVGRARAAITTGAIWALWHLPTAFWPGARPADFPLYFIAVTGAGIWMAWLYERAGRCTLVAIVAHASLNAILVASASRASLALIWALLGAVAAVSLSRDSQAIEGTAVQGSQLP